MSEITELIGECDRLIGEMDPADARAVVLEAIREKYGGGNT